MNTYIFIKSELSFKDSISWVNKDRFKDGETQKKSNQEHRLLRKNHIVTV